MALTIEQIDKRMNSIEEYYNNFNMMSYEYDLKDKMYLGKLYKLKENSVIFFMSGVQNRHQVLEIKKGLRYTLPMWYN